MWKTDGTQQKIKIKDLVEIFGYEIIGNEELTVSGIAYAEDATEDMLGIVRKKQDIRTTKANVLLTEPCLELTEKTLLFPYENLGVAVEKITELLKERGVCKRYEAPVEYSCKREFPQVLFGDNVIIGNGTRMEPFTTIGNDVLIGENCSIGSNVWIGSGTVIGDGVTIRSGSRIGVEGFFTVEEGRRHLYPGIGRVVLHSGVDIGCNTIIQRGTFSDTVIGENTILANLIDIGHDVKIGSSCKIISQTGIAGFSVIGNRVTIFAQCMINNDVTIGDDAVIKGKTRVTGNIPAGETVSGEFARNHKKELRYQAALRKLVEKKG